MMTGALWGRAGNIGGLKTPRFFDNISPIRVTQDRDTILASGAPKGVPLPERVKNGDSRRNC